MKLCGLTGGVGMGKSTAAGFFLQLGVRVLDTDQLARELVELGQPALAEIQNYFGPAFIAADGSLKRSELAKLVFTNSLARRKLEAILHPRIRELWQAQVKLWRHKNCPMAMVVIPLLFETAAEHYFDKIVCMACSPAGQHERLGRRGWTPDQIHGRIAAQWPLDKKLARSDFVIWTEGELSTHQRQVGDVFKKLS